MLVPMQVLVATAGALDPEPVVDFCRHLIGGTGSVTVTTVVEVPRSFLDEIGREDWHPLRDTPSTEDPSDRLVAQYLEERALRVTEPLRLALEKARIPADLLVLEGNDPAEAISAAASRLDVDVVVLGATKLIFDRDAWESVSSRVMLESGKAVLVVPELTKAAVEDDPINDYMPEPENTVST